MLWREIEGYLLCITYTNADPGCYLEGLPSASGLVVNFEPLRLICEASCGCSRVISVCPSLPCIPRCPIPTGSSFGRERVGRSGGGALLGFGLSRKRHSVLGLRLRDIEPCLVDRPVSASPSKYRERYLR